MQRSTKDGLVILVILAVAAAVVYWYSGDDDGESETDDPTGDAGATMTDTSNNPAQGTGSTSSLVSIWAAQIQKFEGYFPGSRSYRDNNPGNLEEEGTDGMDGVYAKFTTFAEGQAALFSDLTAKLAKYPGYTIQQIMSRYSATDQVPYAQSVAAAFSTALGQLVTPETTLSELKQMVAQ